MSQESPDRLTTIVSRAFCPAYKYIRRNRGYRDTGPRAGTSD